LNRFDWDLAEGCSGNGCRESLPNRLKVLALNRTREYFWLVKWYLRFNSDSKTFLHEKSYEMDKRIFNLNTTLIQTARGKVVEIRALGKTK